MADVRTAEISGPDLEKLFFELTESAPTEVSGFFTGPSGKAEA